MDNTFTAFRLLVAIKLIGGISDWEYIIARILYLFIEDEKVTGEFILYIEEVLEIEINYTILYEELGRSNAKMLTFVKSYSYIDNDRYKQHYFDIFINKYTSTLLFIGDAVKNKYFMNYLGILGFLGTNEIKALKDFIAISGLPQEIEEPSEDSIQDFVHRFNVFMIRLPRYFNKIDCHPLDPIFQIKGN